MARRQRDYAEDRALTREQLAAYRQELAEKSEEELVMAYKSALHVCGFIDKRFPSPRIMQELVQVWKQLDELTRRKKSSPYRHVSR